MTAWSPLSSLGAGDRRLPSLSRLPDVLGTPAPRVGQLWSVGNPAALPHEALDAWGTLRLGIGGEDGAYRRPFDGDGMQLLQVSGLRWQPLGARAGVAGRFVADRTLSDPGSYALPVFRHGSDPFVSADTTRHPMRHVRVRMEAAYGWRSGGWGLGVGLGLEMSDDRTSAARAARLGRTAIPAVKVGVLRLLPAGLSLSVHGRWIGPNENSRIALPGGVLAQVWDLDGYGDPEPVDAVGPRVIVRNVAREAYAVGVGLAGQQAVARWAARLEREDIGHEHERQRLGDEAPNRWEADRWNMSVALAALLGPVRATAWAGYSRLRGDAFRRDLEGQGAIFRADEDAFRAHLDLRMAWADTAWQAGVGLWVDRASRLRRDFLVLESSDIGHWQPGVAVEVGRRLSERTAVSLSGGFGVYQPSSTVPDPWSLGPVYRWLVAPELELYGTSARLLTGSATLRHDLARGRAVLVRGAFERAKPAGAPVDPERFDGDRTRWTLEVSAVWAGQG